MKHLYALSLAILALAAVLFSSCERRPLEDRYNPGELAIIPIHIDWSQSQLDEGQINRVSVWMFPKDGSAPLENHIQGNIRDFTIKAPVGQYNVIVFNETAKDEKWDGFIEFRGTDKFETFGVYLCEDNSNLAAVRGKGATFHKTAKAVAAWSIENFIVTQDMVDITRTRANSQTRSSRHISKAREESVDQMLTKVSNVVPQPMVRSVFVHAQVKNLNSAKGATATFRGAMQGVILSTGKTVETMVSHLLPMNNRQYEANKKDGTIECRFMTFGLVEVKEVTINMNFLMHDDTWLEDKHDFNVTKIVNNTQDYEITINIGKPNDDQPVEEDHDVILPATNVDSSVGVGEWDEELVDIK